MTFVFEVKSLISPENLENAVEVLRAALALGMHFRLECVDCGGPQHSLEVSAVPPAQEEGSWVEDGS